MALILTLVSSSPLLISVVDIFSPVVMLSIGLHRSAFYLVSRVFSLVPMGKAEEFILFCTTAGFLVGVQSKNLFLSD